MKAIIWCGCLAIGCSLSWYGSVSVSKVLGLTLVLLCGVGLGATAVHDTRSVYRDWRRK
jgi:hypothetical protein